MKKLILMSMVAALILNALPVQGQDVSSDRLVVNFSDPSRPGLLKVNLFNSGMTVRGYSGREIIIESRGRRGRGRPEVTRDGLRRIDTAGNGLSVEEENNVLSITARNNSSDLEIQVPAKINLNLRTQNGGVIDIEGVEGEIEVTNINGNVILNNVAGSVVAHASNGRVVATLREVTPNKPMSFTSQNSNVDITLPPTAKANLKMRTTNGGIYSDFDIQLRPSTPTVDNQGGRIRIQTDQTITGTINGGGPDFDLRTLNGNIYVRKAK